MSIFKPPTVDETPEIVLASWRVFEVSSKLWPEVTRHFVGYNLTEHSGRVSSAIQKFNKKKMIGTTKSGRSYQLQGNPGNDLDAMYVWEFFIRRNELTDIKDVTAEYLPKSPLS